MTEPSATSPAGETHDPFRGPDWALSREAVPEGTVPTRRRRKVSLRRLKRRRRIGIGMIVLGALIVLTGIWVLITGLLARSQLETVRAEVHQLHAQIDAGNLPGARATAQQIAGHAHRAHLLTTGPAWAVVAALPGADPVQTVRTITAQVDTLSHDVLPQLVTASRELDPSQLRLSGGAIDLARIIAIAPTLDHASSEMAATTKIIAARPAHSWLGAVDHARSSLLTQLTSLGHTLRSADLAAHIAPPMLGADGVRNYFVAFENEAEARGTGGIPGAFAIVRADHGKISFEKFATDESLGIIPVNLDFGPGYDQLFDGAATTSLFVNSNLSPNFPYAAQIWLAMWQQKTGQQLDGALAIDPTALSYLLHVTGPATLPDKTIVSADNVVALTQSSIYAKFPLRSEVDKRKAYLIALARVTSKQVLHSHASLTQLVKAAGRAAGERRLLLYSADPKVQADIAQTSLSGEIPQTKAPYVGLSIVNDGGNKLDYYLDRSISWQRTGCGSMREVTVTVKLTNGVPISALNYYLTARSDVHAYPIKPGDNRLEVSYYGTSGGLMQSVTVDGQPATAGSAHDLGHPVFTVDLELPRGTTRTIVFHLLEPAGRGKPIVLRQPLVRPLHVSVQDARCG